MVNLSSVKVQLARAGFKMSIWGRSEVKELCRILGDDETIICATNGYYEGGFALLVATDQRLLLIDRKPMFLTLDVISYGMIQEISLNYRLLNSTVNIYTSNKVLIFNSWNHARLRSILMLVQQKIYESRLSYRGGANNQPFSMNPQPMQQATRFQVPASQSYQIAPQINYQPVQPPEEIRQAEEPIPTLQDFPDTKPVIPIPRRELLTESFKQPFLARRQ